MASLARRRIHHRASPHVSRIHHRAQNAERRIAIVGAAAFIGFLESRNVLPVSIGPIPTKLALGVVAWLGQMNSSGGTGRLLGAAADASMAAYSYAAAKSGAFVAGDDVGGDEV
jgi:hypothetical protein